MSLGGGHRSLQWFLGRRVALKGIEEKCLDRTAAVLSQHSIVVECAFGISVIFDF